MHALVKSNQCPQLTRTWARASLGENRRCNPGSHRASTPYLSRRSCATATLETSIDEGANGSILAQSNCQMARERRAAELQSPGSCDWIIAGTGQIGILDRCWTGRRIMDGGE